ncbi:LrgB family protein [Cloacibacillus sp. An23]|uniref:LrgB family protein n=1 Tax=Cloacibacillus sp. An23 TaxID=1965591 RepID=UPI000B37F11C|nr:LrgB family protein [Cloacibacillus sp. An23]OUO93961.1 hypothetical protein B5F39_04660 [Cloacibacillus sp. An23]
MDGIISGSLFFGLALTFGAYLIGSALHKKVKTPLLNPLITTNVLVIAFLAVSGVSYDTYNLGAKYIGDLLTPATVCLAIPLYRQLHLLKRNARAICCGIAAGVAANVLSIFAVSALAGFEHHVYTTLLPKSITAAIGMKLSEEMGGVAALTMLATVITGAFGYLTAAPLLRLLRVTDPVAKGIAIGTSSHAFGTLKAFEMGEAEGAMSSLAIAAAGLVTVAAVPLAALLL